MSFSEVEPQIRVASLYQFTHFNDCLGIQGKLRLVCKRGDVRGTLILAPEGINGTIAGPDRAIGEVIQFIRTLPGCAGMTVKDSHASEMPFHRMKVRIKKEIVTMGEPGLSPLRQAGKYVQPNEWNALIADPDTILIDTRNSYEVEVGTFRNAINPDTNSFRDFPAWFRENRASLAEGAAPKIAMFCTGGIRCEKATALLKSEGIDEVYHLQGGILKYLEEVPAEESLWQGECFVFDQRVCLTHGLKAGSFDICHGCRTPVAEADKTSPQYQAGVSCPAGYATRNSKQRERYIERHRQAQLGENEEPNISAGASIRAELLIP